MWKKDYDRVVVLAKGAYTSTSVQDIQAESLFFLARVYHVRGDIDDANKFYDKACKLAPDLSPARFGLAQTLIAQEEYDDAAAHLQLVLGTSNTATDALAALGLLEVKSGKKTQEGLAHLRKAIDFDPLNPDLVLLEALALQQHETNYAKALERYKKAVTLMERQGKKVPFDIYTNIGVLCHETKDYDESLTMYKKALDASDEDADCKNATLDNVGAEGAPIRHPDNGMFFSFVDSGLQVECEDSDEGTTVLKIVESDGKEVSALPIRVGDHIRLGGFFQSRLVEVAKEGDFLSLRIKDSYEGEKTDKEIASKDSEKKKSTEAGKESKESGEKDESKEKDEKDSERSAPKEKKMVSLFVKRENRRLDNPSAITIAFNLARLHEAVGRTLAAVELHKAIVKRNPAYVNSYLRLACIAIDCGALKECAGWLKIAAQTAPGNPEVLTLIGNLHLSLCDWAPAQQVFDGLLGKKIPNVEAYAMLSLGNIYFANLKLPGRYSKHIQYSADYYKRILQKDTANAYAANGLGTVMAEKAELFKAKEVFNRVREVSGDTIADAHLNIGHIYLAQKRHPEALQMYQGYLKRTEDGTAPISSKSRTDDKVDVLLYIAFAYFDWARQTELFNNAKAAPADERYKKAMEHLELALSENTSKNVVLTYNLCMTKLQAANCVLQKLTRNIRRTASEVDEALNGLQQSLDTVEEIVKKKSEGMKVPIPTSMLEDFLTHCRSNIESARSHLEDERKREEESNELRELQRLAAESKQKEQQLQEQLKKEEAAKMQEERDRKVRTFEAFFHIICCRSTKKLLFLLQAQEKMKKVEDLRAGWDNEKAAKAAAAEKKAKKNKEAPDEEEALFPEQEAAPTAQDLFDDSDEESDAEGAKPEDSAEKSAAETKEEEKSAEEAPAETTRQDLFGDSSDEEQSDEELFKSGSKRENEQTEGENTEQPTKKRKLVDDDDSD